LLYNFAREKSLSSTSPNQPVHLTPKARAFFLFSYFRAKRRICQVIISFWCW
jgi:hypothetical protein